MPTDILIYMIVAAIMVFWLRNVIGTRHGDEKQRPNPFENPSDQSQNPNNNAPLDLNTTQSSAQILDVEIGQDEDANAGLVQIALVDKNFNAATFKENAGDAFNIIVKAFADADRDTLQQLCTKDVYTAFDNALKDREAKGETVSTEIHSIRKIDITDAQVEKKTAFVTIRITADETYVITDKNGEMIAGHPDRVTEMTDKWTFTRDLKSSDPRWFLCKTEDDVIEEDGKTPLPDAG